MDKLTGLLFILGACALWAVDTLIRYPLLNKLDAVSLVFLEHAFLSLIFLGVFFKSFRVIWETKTSHYFYFFIIGAVGSAWSTIAFTSAFKHLNPSLVILLQKFQPVFAILLARVVLKEQIKKTFIFWAFICLIGALLISSADIQTLLKLEGSELLASSSFLGYVFVTFSILGWGSATVYGKKLASEGFSNQQIMTGRFMMGLLAILPFMNFKTFSPTAIAAQTYLEILGLVILSGVLAMYLYYKGLRSISARSATLAEMFFPFMAVLVNWVFLGQTLNMIQLIGGLILILGSVVIQLKKY